MTPSMVKAKVKPARPAVKSGGKSKASAAKTASASGPSSSAATTSSSAKTGQELAEQVAFQRRLFFVMFLDMSWQLALVVLIPVIGGYYLDQFFHTFPGLLIAGFLLAALGVVLVMIKIVNKANEKLGAGK